MSQGRNVPRPKRPRPKRPRPKCPRPKCPKAEMSYIRFYCHNRDDNFSRKLSVYESLNRQYGGYFHWLIETRDNSRLGSSDVNWSVDIFIHCCV